MNESKSLVLEWR